MSGVPESNSVEIPTSDSELSPPKKRLSNKKIALITGGAVIVVIIITVLVVVLTGEDDDPETTLAPIDSTTGITPTTDITSSSESTTATDTSTQPAPNEITLDDILSGKLATTRFNSRWMSGTDVLVNDKEGLKLFDVLTETYKILLPKVEGSLFSNASSYSLSPDNKYLVVGYDRVKGYRHSYEASYSVIDLATDVVTSKVAGDETKIFINDETDKLTLVQWAPTGEGLVIIFKNNIYYKPTPSTDPIQITTDGSNKIFNGIPDWVYEEEVFGSNSALRFSPDGKKLAYIQFDDTNVETFEYTYYGDPGTIEAQYPTNMQVSYPKVGTANPIVHAFHIELPNDDLYPIKRNIIEVPLQLATVEHIITTLSWANNDNVVATWMNRIQNEAYIQVCGLLCETIEEIKPTDGWVELFSTPLYSQDGSQFALIMSHDQGDNAGSYRHLTLLSTDGSSKIVMTKGKYIVTQLLHWDWKLNYIFYSANIEEDSRVSHIYAIKPVKDAISQCLTCALDTLDSGNFKYFAASFSKDETLFALNALGPDIPRADIFSYIQVDNKIVLEYEREWANNTALEDKLSHLVKPFPTMKYDDTIVLSSGYKAQVSMILPSNIDESGTKKYPVLINVYGGPDSFSVTFQWGTNWGTYLAAAKDIIYVKIDGRGSGLRGDKLMHEIYLKLGTVEIDDQIETAQLLANKYPFIDRDHIAIWGWSYGGYAAGLALAKDTKNVFKCAVSVAPVTDWTYYDTIYTERYMGLPTDNAIGYNNSRLSTLSEGFKGKNYFLIHGTLDDNVHYQQAMALSRTLEKNDVLFRQMSYPDEDHSLANVQPHLYNTLERYFSDCFHLDY